MKVKTKFGKKAEDIIDIKKNFIDENSKLFKWQKKLFKHYLKQPIRKKCKNCGKKLDGQYFEKISVKYILCKTCGHLNGLNQDTLKLAKLFYQSNSGEEYSKYYISKKNIRLDYKNRVNKIYDPKAKFLINSLPSEKNNYHYVDIGCGSGHFVSSLKKMKITNIEGHDPSKTMINFGNKINNFNKLNFISMDELGIFLKKLKSKKPIVISMIGVFEHIYDNRSILKIIKSNKNIKYFFISVPCYSLSTFIEIVFDKYFQRLMAPQHTHAYSYKSLKYMEKEFDFKIISEWWFGTDIIDFWRSFYVNIANKKSKQNNSLNMFNQFLKPIMDDLQLVIDKNKKSSEAHILFKIN